MVEAEADDAANVVNGDRRFALKGGQSARGLVGCDVAADAVHVQQRADLADCHLDKLKDVSGPHTLFTRLVM